MTSRTRRRRLPLESAIAAAIAALALLAASPTVLATPVAFDIPAQPLDRALALFARQAGLQLALQPTLVHGHTSPALTGSKEPADALAELLRGSGLRGRVDGSTLVVERLDAASSAAPETTLPAVTVKAAAVTDTSQHLQVRANAGALGSRSLLETPLSTTIVTSDDLAQRQVSKLGDVFALDASVTDNSGAYSSWASYITVRGLELDWQNSYRIDGKPFLSYAITLPYEHFEQIELLKGSAGFLYGFGSPGGVVNYVAKKPGNTPVASAAIGFKSNSIVNAEVDLSGRVGGDQVFGYRLGAVHEDGKTFNDGTIRRDSVSLALDARLTPTLTWDFQSLFQQRKATDQTPSISNSQLSGNALPEAPRGDNQNLDSSGQFLDTRFAYYSTGLTYRVAPDWQASTSVSHSTSGRSRNESILYLQDASGRYDEFRSDTREAHRFDQWQALLEGKLATGAYEHQLVFGASWQKQLNDYSVNGVWTALGSGNLFAPSTNGYASLGGLNLYRAGDIVQRSVFASDTMKLSPGWSLLAGLRRTRYAQNDYLPDGSRTGDYADGVTTPTIALMFKAAPETMFYASYMESLEPGRTVGSTYANANRLLDPLVSKQVELGVKAERSNCSGTAALFHIQRPSEYANTSNVLVQEGQSSYQGAELGLAGRLGPHWELAGNLMLLDTSYDKGSANIGNRVAGAPRHMAAVRLAYRVPLLPGLRLSADVKRTGPVMLDAANARELDAHAALNLGASYDVALGGHAATFRASINNVANQRYWEYQYANWMKPVDPLSLNINARMEF